MRWQQKIIRRFIPYSWLIIAVFVGLSALSFKPAIKLLGNISTSLYTLLPDDYPAVQYGNEIKKKFKRRGGGDLILVFSSSNPDANFKAMMDLKSVIEKNPEVNHVQNTKESYDFFDNHKLLFVSQEDLLDAKNKLKDRIQKQKLGSLYINFDGDDGKMNNELMDRYKSEFKTSVKSPYYKNKEGTVYAFWIYPKSEDTGLKFYKKFHEMIEADVNKFPLATYAPDLKIGYAGSIDTRINEYNSLMSDLRFAGLISMAGISLLLIAYFRRIIGVILIFIPLVCGILIGFALCSLFIANLNVVTSFLFSILFGLGADIGIHMFARYLHDREIGLDLDQTIENILLKTGRSSTLGVLTTVATFFILVINDFRGFSEFGWISGIGLTITLITYLVMFPAVLVVADKLKLVRIKKGDHLEVKKGLMKKTFPKAKLVVWGSIAATVIFMVLTPMISFEWNFSVLKFHTVEGDDARAKLKSTTGRVNSPAAVMLDSQEEAAAIKDIYAKRKAADKESPTIDFFRSSYDLFPEDQAEKMKILGDIYVLLSDDALNVLKGDEKEMLDEMKIEISKTKTFAKKDIPPAIAESFFGTGEYTKSQVGFVFPKPSMELDDGRNATAFSDDVHELEVNGKKLYATSDSIVFGQVLKTLFRDSETAICLSFLALCILLYLDFFSVKKAGLVMVILASGIFGMMGGAVLFGWKMNFYNMITIPMVIGMGEDNSVHLINRFEEAGNKSVMYALMTSGKAALLASMTTILGYGGLLFTHHPGLKSIGQMAVWGMITCLFTSLVMLPAYLEWKHRKA